MKRIIQYIYRIFSIYKLYLYEVDLETVRKVEHNITCQAKHVKFLRIDNDNYKVIPQISGMLESNVRRMLSYHDFGVYICVDEKPVGYGWVKQEGSKDAFFSFVNCAYLCRFFIHPDYRGMKLYPLTINYLINEFKHKYPKFYIAIEHKNISSIRGAKKVGFRQINDLTFVRILRYTLNKYKIRTL